MPEYELDAALAWARGRIELDETGIISGDPSEAVEDFEADMDEDVKAARVIVVLFEQLETARGALQEIVDLHAKYMQRTVYVGDIARRGLAASSPASSPEPWEGDPDPSSFGGHPYTPTERALGYGTPNDPRFKRDEPDPASAPDAPKDGSDA